MLILTFCFVFLVYFLDFMFFRLRIRIRVWLPSEMPFAYIRFVNANPSQVLHRPQGSVWKWVAAITCSAWTMCIGWRIHPKSFLFFWVCLCFRSPTHSLWGLRLFETWNRLLSLEVKVLPGGSQLPSRKHHTCIEIINLWLIYMWFKKRKKKSPTEPDTCKLTKSPMSLITSLIHFQSTVLKF